ncbi:hypothetical protein Cob_v001213 [Colletotrichum orbiculare MAFF 240422]|uniref:Uncharacterized protein n=1 Tax=Colletotrichum orbiculare (strain 104-T / ATCC 96160 / CBS 514.97 / LARS 414 / MAFF 240422) TaxID=1213857 RepID=A0A484G837_COLOR|nr:hypothetical protein Cob_v001213 [Colletotrichum orbiculare MAFF 240422]
MDSTVIVACAPPDTTTAALFAIHHHDPTITDIHSPSPRSDGYLDAVKELFPIRKARKSRRLILLSPQRLDHTPLVPVPAAASPAAPDLHLKDIRPGPNTSKRHDPSLQVDPANREPTQLSRT